MEYMVIYICRAFTNYHEQSINYLPLVAFFSLTDYFPDILCQASVTGVTRSTTVIHSQEVDNGRDWRLPKLRTNLATVQFEV